MLVYRMTPVPLRLFHKVFFWASGSLLLPPPPRRQQMAPTGTHDSIG